MCRERYQFRLDSIFKRYFTCFDDEDIEMVKKTRYNGERKLKRELDLVRILKKIRHFSTAFRYLLTERQRFLLKFNYSNVIDSNSDLISLDSGDSLFSCTSDEDLKNTSAKQKVMIKLLEDVDGRNQDCGVRLIDKDLFRGVGRNVKGESTLQDELSSSNHSSSLVDSQHIDGNVAQKVNQSEIEASVIVVAEKTLTSQLQESSYKTESNLMTSEQSSEILSNSQRDSEASREQFSQNLKKKKGKNKD